MKKFSVVTLQILIVSLLLVIPVTLLFASYANHIANIAVTESEKNAQNNLAYVNQTFGLLADSAQSEAVRISSSKDYITAVNDLSSYDQIIQDIDLRNSIADVVHRLSTVQFTDEKLRNVYLYTLDTDFILTSDRGILRLNALNDMSWLSAYQTAAGTGQFRTQIWAAWTVPETDLLSNGSRDGETPVISYISPVRIANSHKISLLVMNYYETKLASLINVDVQNPVYLINSQGHVVCHPQLALLGQDLSAQSHIQAALGGNAPQGYCFKTSRRGLGRILHSDDEILYSYQRTTVGDWILMNENTLLSFTAETFSLTRSYMIALLFILLLGGFLCFYGMRMIMRPIRRLSSTFNGEKSDVRNEILFIEEQIHRMQGRENELLQNVLKSQSDVKKLYLLSLIRGVPYAKEVPIHWPFDGFIVVCFDLDGVAQSGGTLLPMFLLEGSRAFSSLGQVEGVSPDRRSVSFLINAPFSQSNEVRAQIVVAVEKIKSELNARIPLTFTAGIGSFEEGEAGIYQSYRQSFVACRQRMLLGRGQVILYDESMIREQLYRYPKSVELQFINAVAASNRQALDAVMLRLKEELRTQSVDNIPQVLNQLTSAIIAYIREHYVVDDIFDNDMKQWFIEASELETLDELLALLADHAKKIFEYIESIKTEDSYIASILCYIAQHYTEDIDFDRMAEEIGISYSYVRRIVKTKTDQSLLEIVHQTRIEQAKVLLKTHVELSVRDIAVRTGYHNIQSFNRFFKRFEGITPSEYRGIQN